MRLQQGRAPARPWVSSLARRAGCVLGCFCLGGAALCAPGVIGTAWAASAPAGTELDEIRIDGNTVLDPTEMEEAVYPYLGPGKTRDDVEHAREALAALYQKHGYQTVEVEIPPQHVTNGVVYLKVVEQRVERLRVVGAKHIEPAVLKRAAPSLAPGKVPDFNAVKRDVARLNTLPDRSITPSFRPGRHPDTVDVDLEVQDSSPLHGTLELDNRRSEGTTPLRLSGSLSYDNLFQRGDTASLFFQVAPENTADARVIGGSYLFHIPDTILALLVSYLDSDSNVSTVGDLDVVGKGQTASVELQIPLGLYDGFTHSVSAGIAWKNYAELDTVGATGPVPGANSYPVTYYPVTLSYEADFVGARARTSVTAQATFGLDNFGSSQVAFNNKRANADQNFAYLRVNATRTQTLPHDAELYVNLFGQATADVLLPTEQFSAGGLDTVRGYLESEALGDQAAGGQIELRSPSLSHYFPSYVDSWRFHLFADAANVSIHRALVDQASSYTLSSAGIGTRVTLFGYLNASLEDAFLLSRGPDSRAGSNRVLFRIYGSF